MHPFLTELRKKYDLAILSQRSDINELSQGILSALLDHQNVFDAAVFAQSQMTMDLYHDMATLTVNQHQATRDIIIDAVREGMQGGRSESHAANSSEMGGDAARRRAEDRLLRSLLFPSISERYTRVAKAHAATFEWIFREPEHEDRPWSSFSQWLQSGDGIYWITGKAGSGKSTLMRYIYDHENTRRLLAKWAETKPLDVAAHFFWNSGTSDQKSQLGLLKSLLHEILLAHRDLIPHVLPGQWRDEFVYPTEWQRLDWDLVKLAKAFDLLREQQVLRICLFIDGLDEYEGDRDGKFTDMIAFVTQLASSSNIKICLSSRPWLVFEDAFHSLPSLRLQDLTFNDIKRYVEDKISNHKRMSELQSRDPETSGALVRGVIDKASGVFLWVVLVVSSLLEGLTNRDRIPDLQRRLAMLPADLVDLYEHILLRQIDPFYHEQSSRLFQIVCASEGQRLPILTLDFSSEADTELALNSAIRPMSRIELTLRCSEMTDIIKSRCGGLLEVSGNIAMDPEIVGGVGDAKQLSGSSLLDQQDQSASGIESGISFVNSIVGDSSQLEERQMRSHSYYSFSPRVRYLHRTVRDFLFGPQTRSLLLSWTKENFNPVEALVRGHLLHLKIAMVSGSIDGFSDVSRLIQRILKFVCQIEDSNTSLDPRILDELDTVAMHHWMKRPRGTLANPEPNSARSQQAQLHWGKYYAREEIDFSVDEYDDFLSLAVSYGLTSYVRAKLEQDGSLVRKKKGRPLLLYFDAGSNFMPKLELLSLLLEYGADPNASFGNVSLWRTAIMNTADSPGGGKKTSFGRGTPFKCTYPGCSSQFTRSHNLRVHQRNKGHSEADWQRFTSGRAEGAKRYQLRWLDVCKILIEAGAYPNVVWHETSRQGQHYRADLFTPLDYLTDTTEFPNFSVLESLERLLGYNGGLCFQQTVGLNFQTAEAAEEAAFTAKKKVSEKFKYSSGRGSKWIKMKYKLGIIGGASRPTVVG